MTRTTPASHSAATPHLIAVSSLSYREMQQGIQYLSRPISKKPTNDMKSEKMELKMTPGSWSGVSTAAPLLCSNEPWLSHLI